MAEEEVAEDASYNMPPAVAETMSVDDSMVMMEKPVSPSVLAAFEKAHPARFWLFGEDRQLAVRNGIIPAHWFEQGTTRWGRFSGVARPGEFYVFQVCVIAGSEPLGNIVPRLTFPSLKDALTRVISRSSPVKSGDVKPFWVGVEIPSNAKPGVYRGTVLVEGLSLAVSLKVEGSPLAESGTGDAWRLARLKWLDSNIADNSDVTRPFSAIKVETRKRMMEILGRRITIGENGIPAQYTSFFSGSNTRIEKNGRNAFAAPPRLEVVVNGKTINLKPNGFSFTKQTPAIVEWEAFNWGEGIGLRVKGTLEFDGNLQLSMRPESSRLMTLDQVRFVVPFNQDAAKYAMGLGLKGGVAPEHHEWTWNTNKQQDAIWLGDVNVGALLRFKGENYRRPLVNAYYAFQPLLLPESWGGGGIRFETHDGMTMLVAYSGKVELTREKIYSFNVDWDFTPFKPLNVREHFADRYYHVGQQAGVENTADLKKNGVTIMEIHHNRLCNPYINYPFNDDSFGNLIRFINQAHSDGLRVALYYTTRELTQNLPEFFALKSLDGEIILPRREGVAWPVTNPKGPHPWLQQHVGLNIVPAWRENLSYDYKSKLDLAVITTPQSRWNNFYLEGLNYLVRKAKIDGLYIDDTALDRKSMQRARRILDADGNPGRRINMHSWNHFNDLAAWANSSIVFMELYPYYNGLWHGEGFNADLAPDFMLVEMSGIPYGLMSEMLEHPNPWHGMVFGMRTRWPWSGDPREQWKFENRFGIEESDFMGWFDPECPVKSDQAEVKVSVYKKKDKTLLAIGNWGKETQVNLSIDWKSLGLNPNKVTITAPEIKKFQDATTFAVDQSITVPANRGWLIIVKSTVKDEQGRKE